MQVDPSRSTSTSRHHRRLPSKRAGIRHGRGPQAPQAPPYHMPLLRLPIADLTTCANARVFHAVWRAVWRCGCGCGWRQRARTAQGQRQPECQHRPQPTAPDLRTGTHDVLRTERVEEDEQATLTPGTPHSPPPEVILSPATPPTPAGSTPARSFENRLVGGGSIRASGLRRPYHYQQEDEHLGPDSWVVSGHRGRLWTWTTQYRRRRRETGGSRRRHRTRKRSGRQLRRLLPLLQAKPQSPLRRTVAKWRCTYRRRTGSRTARRSLYIDARRLSSIRRAMRRDTNAGAARAARCCRVSVA